jgi:acyl-CoA thioesterase-1
LKTIRLWQKLLCGSLVAIATAPACGSREQPSDPPQSPPSVADAVEQAGGTVESSGRPLIVVLGDSLTAGLGLSEEQAYPALLQERIDAAGFDYEVVNAGVSGDTSAGGLRRLDWALEGDVRILIVALGANDGLRGVPAEELKRNLGEIIEKAQARGAAVILAGMEAPPNFGTAYTNAFRAVYAGLVKQYGVKFVPFLLEGVAGVEVMNQRDGIHPNAEGAVVVTDRVWAVLQPMVEDDRGQPQR